MDAKLKYLAKGCWFLDSLPSRQFDAIAAVMDRSVLTAAESPFLVEEPATMEDVTGSEFPGRARLVFKFEYYILL